MGVVALITNLAAVLRNRRKIKQIANSGLFDHSWYRKVHPAAPKWKSAAIAHYLERGAAQGQNPNPEFNTVWYLTQNPDVAAAKINPLIHYIRFGAAEGRDPSPEFSTRSYLKKNPGLLAGNVNPLRHYLSRLNKEGRPSKPYTKGFKRFELREAIAAFDGWQMFNCPNPGYGTALREVLHEIKEGSSFSIIVVVEDWLMDSLREIISSVLQQSYAQFEVIVSYDSGTDPQRLLVLKSLPDLDARIKLTCRLEGGPVTAFDNSSASIPRGEFIIFLEHGDLLHRDALAHFAHYVRERPDTDMIYCDDAAIRADGNGLEQPRFKPDWSPELLLSHCYISHVTAVRNSLYKQIGGGLEEGRGHIHDMLLRASERANHIGHVARILCHRRVSSTPASHVGRPQLFECNRHAVREAFARRGIECAVEQPDWALDAGVEVGAPTMPDDGPSVAIIIPTKNNWQLVDKLVQSLRRTTYRNYKIYIIDNMSEEQATVNYLKSLPCRIFRIPNPGPSFSFAYINNRAVERVTEDYVLFLNNDTEIISARWLSQMMGWARLPGVGAVGARLLFPDGRVQHGGVVIGLRCGLTALRGLPGDEPGYLYLARVSRNCSAVTAAAMLTPRTLFLRMGGFDEQAFAISYNDVDYCMRLHDAGWRSVYCAEAELYHYASYTRDKTIEPSEAAALRSRYGSRTDPFYSPHLSLDTNRYDIRPTVAPLSTRKLRILAVVDNLGREDTSYSTLQLITGLKQQGIIDPVVLTSQVGPLAEEYTVSGVTIITSPHLAALESIVELQDYEKVVTAVLNEIDVRSFDLIHSNGIKSFWAIDAAQRCRVPSVWSIRDSESWKSSFAGLAESVAARALECCSYAYRVVFTAKRVRRDWTPADRMNNFEVIDNGLDVAQFERAIAHPARHEARATIGLCDHDVCLLTWSALLDRRSRRDLISAIQQLPEDVARRAFFLIVGSGEANYERVFTELTRELPASRRNRVVLMNEEDGMGVLWNAADVLFCTSRFKYYSRIALQAMAKELPVLASSTFGFAEYVRTKINGITFRQGDLSELVDAIAQIVRRDELRAAFGKNSKHLYTTFDSLEEVRGQYADIYRAAAESSVPPRDPLHWDPKVLLAL